MSFESKEEAEQAATEYRRRLYGTVTTTKALSLYKEALTAKGNKPRGVAHTIARVEAYLEGDSLLVNISEAKLRRIYEERVKTVSVDTHRGELAELKTFFRWAVKQGWMKRSPAEGIEGTGRRRRGKKQLRNQEARAFYSEALRRAHGGDEGAIAALSVLLLGLRSSEIRSRLIRDVDVMPDTTILWIPHGKTPAAVRRLEVPAPLDEIFQDRVRDQKPEAYLFASSSSTTGYRDSSWLRSAIREICEAVEVPVVCPHGLRGTWATLATDAGVAAHLVARELGHGNDTITREHYMEPGVEDRVRVRKVFKMLEGEGKRDLQKGEPPAEKESPVRLLE
jgi:integrase/recombinase XerD